MKILSFLVLATVMFVLMIGMSAFGAWLVMMLWNFIAVSMHRSDLQMNFWVAWAAMILLGLISGALRPSVSVRSR
jgi:hypothetical protein